MKAFSTFSNNELSAKELMIVKGGQYDGGPVDLNDEDIDMPDL